VSLSTMQAGWYALISPEWCLVVVGIATAIVIGWQSVETRKAAQASRDSISFSLKKERARLSLGVWQVVWTNNPHSMGQQLKAPAVEFVVTNSGPTHAFNVRLYVSYIAAGTHAPVTLPAMTEVTTTPIIKAEGKDWRPVFHFEYDGLDDLGALMAGEKLLHLAGRLSYTDVFGEERETRFRFIYAPANAKNQWVEHGSEWENGAT